MQLRKSFAAGSGATALLGIVTTIALSGGTAAAQSTYPVPDCSVAAKTTAVAARDAVKNRLTTTNVSRFQRALSVKTPFTAFCPGKITIRITYKVGGTNVSYASGTKTKTVAGKANVSLRSTSSGRAALRLVRDRDRSLKTAIRVSFNPTSTGSTRTSTLAIAIK